VLLLLLLLLVLRLPAEPCGRTIVHGGKVWVCECNM
jgi:hypothetical protein